MWINLAIIFWFIVIFETQLTDSFFHSHSHFGNETLHWARAINEDFQHFQKSGKRISGRDSRKLISFDTRNDDIEVGLEFSVPFITIPVKRSIDNLKNWGTKTTTYLTNPVANVNTGAIALTGVVAMGAVAGTFLWKTFIRDQVAYVNRPQKYPSSRSYVHPNEMDEDNPLSKLFETVEKILQKYNIDATTCTQRTLCSSVQDASQNVARGVGSSTEKIFDGITSASWMKRFIAGTAINDAISAGQHNANCERKYSGCKLKFKSFEQLFETVILSLQN